VSANGLQLHDAATGQQLTTPGELDSHPDWVGARRIWTGSDASGVPVVFALNESNTAIARWLWTPGSPEQLAPIESAMNAIEVLTMQYDAGAPEPGEVEIVVQIGNLVVVLDWVDLDVIAWFEFTEQAPGGNQNLITVSHGNNDSAWTGDHLVAYGYRQGQFQLFVLNAGSAAFVPLGDGDAAAAIAAFDDNGDGIEEITIANGTRSAFRIVARDPDTGAFDTAIVSHVLTYGPLRADGPVDAWCGGDFDGDGDGDFVGFQSQNDYMHVAFGTTAPAARPVGAGVSDTQSGAITEGGGPSLQLIMWVDVPANWASLAAANETAYVEIHGWVRPDVGLPLEPFASIQVSEVASQQVTVLVATQPGTTVHPTRWSVVVHGRLVMVGPNGERRLPVRARMWSPDLAQMQAAHALAWACRHGTVGPAYTPHEVIGTGGDGNTTDPSGGGRPPNEPPRP
jgi:hypothetical protein